MGRYQDGQYARQLYGSRRHVPLCGVAHTYASMPL
jgi:hypothetical protein